MIIKFPTETGDGSLDYTNVANDFVVDISLTPFAITSVATAEPVIAISGRIFPAAKSRFLKKINAQIPVLTESEMVELYSKYQNNQQNPVRLEFEPPGEALPVSYDGVQGALFGILEISSAQAVGVDPAGGLLYSCTLEFRESIL